MEELKDAVPFHALFCGPTNSGKSKYLIDQLRGPFRNVFDYIVLICPTYASNKTYRGFARGDKRFFVLSPDASNSDEINELLACCETLFSGTNTLIILDDCAASKDVKQRSSKLISLAMSGRHLGISLFVLTQQLTSIAKPLRDNVACVISHHNPSQVGTKTLFEDYGGDLDVETRKKFMEILKTEKYSRLCFCLRHPFQTYIEIPATLI